MKNIVGTKTDERELIPTGIHKSALRLRWVVLIISLPWTSSGGEMADTYV
jgi:hypothetical protein